MERGADLSPRTNLAVALVLFGAGAAALLRWTALDGPAFHTILDTSVLLVNVVLVLLLSDIASRSPAAFPRLLAVCFGVAFLGELGHTATALETLSGVTSGGASEIQWRAGTWGVPAHILPISLCAALMLGGRQRKIAWPFFLGLVALAAAITLLYMALPRYAAPGFLGITRPTLILVPLLWLLVGTAYWRARERNDVTQAIALMAVIMVIGHGAMLFSRAPNDAVAMVAHLAKLVGKLYLLVSVMQIGAAATVHRLRAERALRNLNQDLESRVVERTSALQAEIALRGQTEQRLQTQFDRLSLLHQITRSIGARMDLPSIFQVVTGSLEDQLPVDFVCLCLYDDAEQMLTVASTGVKSRPLALELAMPEAARVAVDKNGLSRCVRGELVYEPDIAQVDFPFPQRLSRGGFRALVVSPLAVQNVVFGVLMTARREANSFSSSDCEFLRQLSEHVGLATHQARLHETLQRAYDDLRQSQQVAMQQERLRAIGQMASGIAHDINNAILPASIYTQALLETEPNLSERARSRLETIKRAVDDVGATVGRMREFYREREPEVAPMPVDLNQSIQQAIELTRARWSDIPQRTGIVIAAKTDLAPSLPPIAGIESEIREVLTNLIFNAVDAMPRGGTLTLRTSVAPRADASGSEIRLDVADTGTGMDEATRRRCLEPFYTTKGERGTGLGLAMVYGVVQRHGARIEIESAPGEGTVIRLVFPVMAAPTAPEPAVPVTQEEVRPLRILLVDDDPHVLDSMAVVLELDGHSIVAAQGGQAGIDAFRDAHQAKDPFSVVITDLGMPNVDGSQVAHAIKTLSPATPIVLLTGWGRRLSGDRDHPADVDFTLAKPPQLPELRAILQRLSRRPGEA